MVMVASLVGCATGPSSVPEDIRVVEIKDVRRMLDTADPLGALEALDTLKRSAVADTREMATLGDRAVALLREELGTSLRDGRIGRSLSLASSLEAMGLPAYVGQDGVEWGREKLLFEAARKSSAEGPQVLATFYGFEYASAVGLENVVESDRQVFLAGLEMLKDPATLRHARRLLGDPGPGSASSIPLSEPMKATVTVLVDRGLQIQNRVGVPNWVQGSGFYVDPKGYILTNYHVISSEVDPKYEGFSRLYVVRPAAVTERIPARVVGYDVILDLALLKVEVESEYAYYPGLETDLSPGDRVVAIGTPLGLASTVSEGVVSFDGRRFLQLGDVMQIAVPVNPGNSGGPLLDTERRLVGVVFAGLEQTEGLNFAIPNGWIARVLPRLFAGGPIKYGWLAASVAEVAGGLEVVYTVPGGPAARVGIQEGDILERIAGRSIGGLAEAQGQLMEMDPPALVKVEWRSGTERREALVALADRPDSPVETALQKDTRDRLLFPLFGMKLEKIGQSFGKARYVVKRVLAGSQAAEIGLTPDDPLYIESWRVDQEQKIAVVNIYVKKKSSGYLDGVVGLSTYLEQDSFL
jgi:S1-C subfamily serine protease